MQYVYPEGIPSAEAFGTPKVVTLGIVEERDVALPLSFVKRGGASLNIGGGGGITRGIKIEGRRVRVRVTARRVVVVTTRELGSVVGAAVGGFANHADGRGAAVGLLIGYGVGWLWDSYGPTRTEPK